MGVGTHALKKGTKLWTRFSQHRGLQGTGGGNHRGSIFRLLAGTSIIARNGHKFPTWGEGNNAPAEVRAGEVALECEVSKVIGAMPFLWLAVEDVGGMAGAGVEYGFTPNLSAKLEYLYTAAASLELWHVNEVRAGLNYRFGGY